jgi:hypothetical protein
MILLQAVAENQSTYRSDKGTEFYNKHNKKLVHVFRTQNEEKCCVVERWNRTMKDHMFKYFTVNNTRPYIDVLNDMVSQ